MCIEKQRGRCNKRASLHKNRAMPTYSCAL